VEERYRGEGKINGGAMGDEERRLGKRKGEKTGQRR